MFTDEEIEVLRYFRRRLYLTASEMLNLDWNEFQPNRRLVSQDSDIERAAFLMSIVRHMDAMMAE